jgi:DNA polymerase III subunit alpha
MAFVREYAERSKEIDQQYLCISDHGVMGAVPEQISESEKHGLFAIFGVELYVNQLQPKSNCREESAEYRKNLPEDQQKRFDKSSHLLAIAYNNDGYKNLVRLTSWAWKHGFYKRPRINHEILQQYKDGLIFTSTCASSEIATAFLNNQDDQEGFDMVEKYMAMFGDKFYLELMMLDYKLQKPYDAFLIRAHDKYHIPLFMSQDCHFCKKEHSKFQRIMLMMQAGCTIQEVELMKASGDDDIFVLQDPNLWMKSETELNEMWETSDFRDIIDYELYKQSKANTVEICRLAKGVEIDRSIKLPELPKQNTQLMQAITKGFYERNVPRDRIYLDRMKMEYELIKKKGFASYFLIEQMMVKEAQRVCPELCGFDDVSAARGPGRGSVGGSLIAYLLDIHDVDPIEHDLSFSRFLSWARGGKQMRIRFTQNPIEGS